ncbi:MAG: hypothetical protein ABI821_06980 [Pseudomonadota bacterium]
MELRYADLRSEAGFTDSEFEQFIDLKVSQELNPLAPNNDRIEADEEAAGREAEERDELLARFGAEKTARLRQFEKTLPARAEVGELRDLLEREALGVTAAQRSAMIKAAIASGAGMPLRKISDAESNTAVYQEILALQELSDQRMRSSARGILSGAQMQAYEAFLMDRRDSLEDTIRNVAEEERSDK